MDHKGPGRSPDRKTKFSRPDPRLSPLFEAFERGYKEGGYRAGWKRYAEYRAAGFGKTHWNPTRAAGSYVKAGENALALDWLEKAFEAHDPNLPYVFIGPGYDPLRSEPRFQTLRRKMNLPQ